MKAVEIKQEKAERKKKHEMRFKEEEALLSEGKKKRKKTTPQANQLANQHCLCDPPLTGREAIAPMFLQRLCRSIRRPGRITAGAPKASLAFLVDEPGLKKVQWYLYEAGSGDKTPEFCYPHFCLRARV
jgi:hypothetical protein